MNKFILKVQVEEQFMGMEKCKVIWHQEAKSAVEAEEFSHIGKTPSHEGLLRCNAANTASKHSEGSAFFISLLLVLGFICITGIRLTALRQVLMVLCFVQFQKATNELGNCFHITSTAQHRTLGQRVGKSSDKS